MMRSSALLIGALVLLAPSAWAQSGPNLPPAPPPKAKSAAPTPPAAVPAPKPQVDAAQQQQQSGSSLFPFKLPGFGSPATTTTFDANQRVLIDRVNMYLMSVQTMTGDFVQVG